MSNLFIETESVADETLRVWEQDGLIHMDAYGRDSGEITLTKEEVLALVQYLIDYVSTQGVQ